MPPQVISVVQKTAGRVFQDSPPFRIAAEDHDPSERKYKHVYYHSTSTTWQIVRGGFPNVMCHLDQDTVAARAAKAWGVSLKSLRLAPSKPKPEERISYPCVSISTSHGTLKVRLGECTTPEGTLNIAVKMACKPFRVSRAELELRRPRPHHNNKTHSCKRFAILMRTCKGTNHQQPLVSCDFQDLLRRVSTSRVLQDGHACHCSRANFQSTEMRWKTLSRLTPCVRLVGKGRSQHQHHDLLVRSS